MDRRSESNNNNQPQLPFYVLPVLLIIRVFIAIGSMVRKIFSTIIYFSKVTYSTIIILFKEMVAGTKSWLHEKKEIVYTFLKKRSEHPKEPKKRIHKAVYSYPKFSLQEFGNTVKALIHKQITYIRASIASRKSDAQARKERKHTKQLQLEMATQGEERASLMTLLLVRLKEFFYRAYANVSKNEQSQTYKKEPLDAWKSFITGVVCTVLFVFIPYESYNRLMSLPNPHLLSRRDLQVTTKIFDRKGILLYEIYLDQNRTPLPLKSIPNSIIHATISIEDRDFYKHQGISLKGIARAAKETVFNKQVQGGSTITQQLIKSALLSPEVKITRKIKEVLLAFWTERLYTKNQILEMYLNQVPYGGTAWGIEAASQTYFGKSATNLTLAESALLAGLPAAPTEYSPFGSHPEKAFARQKEVLRRMVEDRYISQEDATNALNTQIKFATPNTAIRAPHFVMYVKSILEQQYGERLVDQGGLQIKTSLDITIQEKAEEILARNIESLKSLNVGNGAALVTNPTTGEILAMVGSKNYFDIEAEGNVNVTTALRQPGSSIKVVNYAAALENGFTAASLIDDSPITFTSLGSPPYSPVNYDGKFHGTVPFRSALANSYNIPAVKLLQKIGLATMLTTGKNMGVTTWGDESRFGLSLTLGGGEVTMLDMAKVYGALAYDGKRTELQPILEVTDYAGRVYQRAKQPQYTQAIKSETAWIISNILSDNVARTPAFGPNSSLVVKDKTVSVKTGTTDNKRDNWTIGYTPSFVTTVWVGNNDNTPMNPYLTSGITGAAPIWHDIMQELLKNKQDEIMKKPDTVIAIPCYFGRVEYFIAGTQPQSGRCNPLPTPSATPTP